MDHKIKINIIIIIIRLRIMVEVHEVEEKDFKKRVKTINFLKNLINKQIIRNLKVLALVEEVKEFFRTKIHNQIKINFRKNLTNNKNLKTVNKEVMDVDHVVINKNQIFIKVKKKMINKYQTNLTNNQTNPKTMKPIPIVLIYKIHFNLLPLSNQVVVAH